MGPINLTAAKKKTLKIESPGAAPNQPEVPSTTVCFTSHGILSPRILKLKKKLKSVTDAKVKAQQRVRKC